jgi:DNA polymerase-3 subunit chi
MTRVDFYLLNQAGEQARQLFACRLADKAYRLENTVHIQAANADDAARLDDLLWTFRDGSFVPHHRIRSDGDDQASPVTVGCGDLDTTSRDLLINLCDDVPSFAGAFRRIAELVTADPECKQLGRKRFASYRDSGYTLETHDV